MNADPIDLRDVQGIAFYAYSKHPHARYLLVTFAYDDARTYAWLRALVSEVRHAKDAHDLGRQKATPNTVQVAFTARGLLAFGLDPADVDDFPREYLLGMNEPERSKILGDTTSEWTFGAPQHDEIHAVVMLFSRTEAELSALAGVHRDRLGAAGARIVHEDEGRVSTSASTTGFRSLTCSAGRARRSRRNHRLHPVSCSSGTWMRTTR